ncbi:MAG: CopD family protein [Gemmatimonadota bacterium]|nr:CopD family protein [Gemmatimonadota bacterium]
MARHRPGRAHRPGGLRLHGGGPIEEIGPGPVLDAITGWVLFAAILGSIGAVALRWAVLPWIHLKGYPSDTGKALVEGAARFGSYVALFVPLAFLLVFTRQLLEFRDPFVPWTEDAHLLLTGTSWGRTFIFFGALGVAVGPAFRLARRHPAWGWALVTAMVLALGAFPALTGHASAGEGVGRALTLGLDVLHVWAAGAWIGGLAGVLFLDTTMRRRDDTGPRVLPALIPAFSTLAIAGVGTLVVTGTAASWIHLPRLSALLSEPYGRTLLIKLTAVGLVLGLGWLNWKRLTPRLARPSGADTLYRGATLELVVAQLVLLVTAVLVRTPPNG